MRPIDSETTALPESIQVLVVEDNEHDARLLRGAMTKSEIDFEITHCVRAEDALERLADSPSQFDLVVADQHLPGMSGLELCQEVHERGLCCPSVLLTGEASREIAAEALLSGADDYLIKSDSYDHLTLLPIVFADVVRRHRVRRARDEAERALAASHNELERRVRERTAELSQANAELKRSRQRLRALAAELMTVQEEERRRIAAELHDDLSQSVAMLAAEMGRVSRILGGDLTAVREQLQELHSRALDISEGLRQVSHRLHPAVLEHFGLGAALESYCRKISKHEGFAVEFVVHNLPGPLPREISLCLYRVAQEALRNASKHSGATRVEVVLGGTDRGLRLVIRDDGVGFDTRKAGKTSGLGLLSLQERVKLVDGRISLESRPGQGTEITVEVPME